jgi:hypothetical protein
MEGERRPLPRWPSPVQTEAGYAIRYLVEDLAKRDVAAQFRQKAQQTQLVFLIAIGLLSSGHRLTPKHSPRNTA